jgi:hypothetical protein
MNYHVFRSRRLCFGLLCLGLWLLPAAGFGQEKAVLTGTVTDPSGAVMPGVKVTITDTLTGVARTLETNAAGAYLAPELVPGTYDVKAEMPGFKTYTRTGIVLNVNDNVRVDIPMQVGQVTQTVEVSAEAVKVQTESGEVSDLVSGRQVTQLAVNTRNFFVLATLTTGVSSDIPDSNLPIPAGSSSSVRFNGQRNDHNIYMIDGGEDYDRGCGGCVTLMPSMDAFAEFKVMTSNNGADFGIGSGGTVNISLKSGTKDFHGTAYEFFRSDKVDAADFFTNKGHGTKAHLRYNNFGYNIGGPIYIPGHYNTDKRKTFFFWNEEWRRIRQGTTVYHLDPTQAERGGDFSLDSYTVTVPTTSDPAELAQFTAAGVTPGKPFPGNKIPSSLIDPNATLFLQSGAFPLPTSGEYYAGSASVPINVREELVRVDHNFSDKISVMAHFINDAVDQVTNTTLWSGSTFPTLHTNFLNPGKGAVLHLTDTISPTLLNEISYNYNGNRIWLTPIGIYAKPSGWTGKEFFGNDADKRMPTINLTNQFGGLTYDNASWPWHNAADSQQGRDDISWMKGPHAMKFGGQFMRYRKNQDIFGNTQGNFTFDGTYSGSDLADFLLGFAHSYNELALEDRGHWRTSTVSLYFTDAWRATKRLTVNLGARWEIMPHVYEVHNRMSNFYPNLYNTADAPIFNADGSLDSSGPGFTTVPGVPLSSVPFYMNGIGLAGKNGVPRGLVNNYYDAIGPRLGFAYDLTGKGKTVLRGGYGTFFERTQGNDVYDMGSDLPFSFNPNVTDVYFTDPTVSNINGAKAAVPIFPGGFTALAKNYLLPTSHQWSMGLQDELMPRAVLSVMYVGNEDSREYTQRNINTPLLSDPRRAEVANHTLGANLIRPYLGFAGITYGEPSTSADYNSLQVNFRVDNYKGFTFQGAYTWAHSIDYQSCDTSCSITNPYDIAFDHGSSDFDRRQVFVMNYIYDLPFLKNNSNAFVRQAFGGWQLSGITTFETGEPHTISYAGDNAGVGGAGTRPDLIGNPNSGPKNATAWFNTAAFAVPAPLTWGTEGRDVVWGPGRNNWNISLFKVFRIPMGASHEAGQLQFRGEFFNAFNHTQFNGLNTGCSPITPTAAPGSPCLTTNGFGAPNGVWDPRIIQFGLKLTF